MNDQRPPVELLVCVKCQRSTDISGDAQRPGEKLYARLEASGLPQNITLRAVECLQNCDRGCSVALRGEGRWTYVYGNFNEDEHVEILSQGAEQYQATEDGLIPWRSRSQHFRKNCIARIPPLEA